MFTPGMDADGRTSSLTPLTEEPAPEMIPDWHNIGLFATGIALGAVLGAAVALLAAPASGRDIRRRVARRFSGGGGEQSVWEELADELARAKSEIARAPRREPED